MTLRGMGQKPFFLEVWGSWGRLVANAAGGNCTMDDAVEDLFSLRLTGKKRLWGIRDRHVFKVFWWDPEHGVCPSELK